MKLLFKTILFIVVSSSAFALQKQAVYTLSDSPYALGLTRLEMATKSGLIKMRLLNKEKFIELKKKENENSELYQSYINEVDELFLSNSFKKFNPKMSYYDQYMKNSKIDLAKKIAKHEMLRMIHKNWDTLKNSIFNEYGAETWKQASFLTQSKLNEIFILVPRHPNSRTHYLFLFGDNFIQLDKSTLKRVRVVLDVNSRLDANILPPDAATIIPDDAFSKTTTSGSSSNNQPKKTENTEPEKTSAPPPSQDDHYIDHAPPELEVF